MKALSFLTRYYYSEGLMVTVGIIALVISIMNYRRHKELRIFFYYLLFSLAQIGSIFYKYMRPAEHLSAAIAVLMTIAFMLFENIVSIVFIYSRLVSRKRKLAIAGLPIFFVIGFLLILKYKTVTMVFQFFLVDCVSLTIPCFLYFYELFLYPSNRPLKASPAFWVITGILFLNCCSIPLYLSEGMKSSDLEKISALNFILYAFFYGMLARAFLCSPATAGDKVVERASVRLEAHGNIEPIN